MNELTIASIYHSKFSKRFLELNRSLTDTLNTRRDFSWIAVNNAPHDFAEGELDPRLFRVLKGIPFAEYQKTLQPWQEPFKISMHYSYAMHMALRQADTRFTLILDGDFYIVRSEWIEHVLSHMKANDLALMGVPWHPRWHTKTRYFPTLHALFIDARKIPPASLDFRPKYQTSEELPFDSKGVRAHSSPSFLKAIKNNIAMRKYTGASKDSSYALYERYQKSAFHFETFTPTFKPYQHDSKVERFIKLWIDTILPDNLSLTPRIGTYTTRSFKDRGYADPMGQGWEEFVWQDKPFGFHMRNTGNTKRSKEDELMLLEPIIDCFKERPVV